MHKSNFAALLYVIFLRARASSKEQMSVVVEWTPQYSRNRRNQGVPCTTDFSSGQREAAHTHTHTHAGRVRELRVVLMLQQRPDPRRTRLEELLADGTVARLALNLGELLGDEMDSDVRPRSGRGPWISHYTNTAACVMRRRGCTSGLNGSVPVITSSDPSRTEACLRDHHWADGGHGRRSDLGGLLTLVLGSP